MLRLERNIAFINNSGHISNSTKTEPGAQRHVNPAILTEMNICTTGAFYKRNENARVKKCTCSVLKDSCPSHHFLTTDRSSGDGYFMHTAIRSRDSISSSDDSSHCTVIAKSFSQPSGQERASSDELKLSLTSLISSQRLDDTCKRNVVNGEDAFRNWLTRKNREKKRIALQQSEIQTLIVQERENKLELERMNFIQWLTNKKLLEKRKQEEEQKRIEQLERENVEKQKMRQILNERNYQRWLKKKSEQCLLQKIQENLMKLKHSEKKQKRLELNVQAYEEWFRKSKNKPKPVPLNRGLETLRTSVSISFINPTPWVPNIQYSDTQK